jgi:hypothetical protein
MARKLVNPETLSAANKAAFFKAKKTWNAGFQDAQILAEYPPFCLSSKKELMIDYLDALNMRGTPENEEDFLEKKMVFNVVKILPEYTKEIMEAQDYKQSPMTRNEAIQDYCAKHKIELSDWDTYHFGMK